LNVTLPKWTPVPISKDDTEDVDDIQESEHFDTRQSCLNLCQGNHYQFDQLRRVKHTSMMVLYHLHNPDVPKFMPNCSYCRYDILAGLKHRCETCDLDFCNNCVVQHGARIHSHPLRPTMISSSTSASTQLTEEQRKERQRSIQLHLQLLQHAVLCGLSNNSKACASNNCLKMKDFLKHPSECEKKTQKGCRLCYRITNLLNLHAKGCRQDDCKVPQCQEIRDHNRQLAMRQHQMDDRRRSMMNEFYQRGGQDKGED